MAADGPTRTCPSGKVTYTNRHQAIAALRCIQTVAKAKHHRVNPRAIYHCGVCGDWHLTSQRAATRERRRRR